MKKYLVICIFLLAALSLGAQAIEVGLHAGPDIWGMHWVLWALSMLAITLL